MAETAATIAFFSVSSFPSTPPAIFAKFSFCPSPSSSFAPPRLFSFSSAAAPSSSSSSLQHSRAVVVRASSKDSSGGDFTSNNPFSFFPWGSNPHGDGSGAIEWVQEERVTLFTADGLIQIGGSIVPRQVSSFDKKQGKGKPSQKIQRFQEQDYVDPNQGLCLGALFDIAATNVVAAEKASDGGLQEKLTMTVAVPLLWGVPPASETLHFAVRNGGGIVEKVYWQWDFL